MQHTRGDPVDAISAPAIEHYADALAQFEHLLGRLTGEAAQRATHGELEAMVQAEGSELLRRLIQGHLDQRGREEPMRERVIGADGKGFVMHPSGLREATRRAMEREEHKQHTRLSPGEKKNRKRMAAVSRFMRSIPTRAPRGKSLILTNNPRRSGRDRKTNAPGPGWRPIKG